jgi:hypothetical protein
VCPKDPDHDSYGVNFAPKFGAGVELEAVRFADKTQRLVYYDFGVSSFAAKFMTFPDFR